MEHILQHFKGGVCLYCSSELVTTCWNSEWGDNDIHHYKSCTCSTCGKKNWLLVDFEGSGHDNLMKNRSSRLESAVQQAAKLVQQ